MPTYKIHSSSNPKDAKLPLYRPLDKWVVEIWEKRQTFAPVLGLIVVALFLLAGFQVYQRVYEDKAANVLNTGDLKGVLDHYPRSGAAQVARMKMGLKAVEENQPEKAIPLFDALVSDTSTKPILKIAAMENLALVYWKKGEKDKALEWMEKASKDVANQNPDYSTLLLAYLKEKTGDVTKAKELYKSLSEGSKDLSVMQEAKERWTWLEPQKTVEKEK